MPARLSPFLLLALLALLFFGNLVLHPGQVLYADHSDLLTETLPAKRFLVRSWQQTGEVPLWCPYNYAGMPFAHDIKVAAFYPLHAPLYLLPETWMGPALSWLVVLHVVLAGWFMYAYASSCGLGRTGAVVAAVGYMFAGKWLFHVLAGGHYIMAPLAWLPLVLLWLEQAIRRSSLVRATCAGAAFALVVLAAHPQMTLYAGWFVALWTLGPALERAGYLSGHKPEAPANVVGASFAGTSGLCGQGARSWRRTGAALGCWLAFGAWAGLMAGALAAVELVPAMDAMAQATRGGGVPSGGGLALIVFLTVELVGAPLAGPQWERPGGLAILWVACAVLAPVLCRGRVRFQAAVGLAVVIFGLGGGAALQWLPGFHFFQLQSRMLILAAVPLALLTGAATQALANLPAPVPTRRCRLVLLAVLAGCLLLVASNAGLTTSPIVPHPYWLVLLLTVPAAFWLLGRVERPWWDWAWSVILLADLWALVWPLVIVCPEDAVHRPSQCISYLAEHWGEHGRVLDRGLTEPADSPLDPALPMLLEIESLRGYNSVDVRRYKEYLQFIMDEDRPLRPREGPFGFPIMANFPIKNKALLDLLGTRYLLRPSNPPIQSRGWHAVAADANPRAYLVITGGVQDLPPYTVYENLDAFPRAFVVPEAAPLPERQQVLPALKATDFHRRVLLEGFTPHREVMCAPRAGTAESGFREIKIEEYQPNRVVLDLAGGPGGYLVLADVWFPGWTCRVDGEPVPIHRANYLFRGVELPAGARQAVFTFAPASYHWGKVISVVGLLVVVSLTLFATWARRFRSQHRPVYP